MKHLLVLLFAVIASPAFAKGTKALECESKAKDLVKAILTVQDSVTVVRLEVLAASREEDDVNAYETYDIQGYSKDKKGVETPVRSFSRIVLFPEYDTCALIGYSMPTAG